MRRAPCSARYRAAHPDGTRATGDDDIVEHAGVQRPVRDGRGIGEGSLNSVPVYRAARSHRTPQYRCYDRDAEDRVQVPRRQVQVLKSVRDA